MRLYEIKRTDGNVLLFNPQRDVQPTAVVYGGEGETINVHSLDLRTLYALIELNSDNVVCSYGPGLRKSEVRDMAELKYETKFEFTENWKKLGIVAVTYFADL